MRSSLLALILAPSLALASTVTSSTTIPAFARKYKTTCATCHSPIPRLNAVGEAFAANGFEFKPGEEPRDTVGTGDPLLRLQNNLPLAIRYDAYLTALTNANNGQVVYDQQIPWVIKLLSGGQVSRKISYYVYFLLTERGEVEGLEDAYIQFTDIKNSGVSIAAGQFQISDPMFKRETRLEYEDYQPYLMRVGASPADLTYDRGFMATWSPREGTDLALEVVSGQGLEEASANVQYDRDNAKTFLARVSQDLGPLRLGAFGYFGREEAGGTKNTIRMFGPDATLTFGDKAELNVQWLRRTDDDPWLGGCSPTTLCAGSASPFATSVDAAFAELVLSPKGKESRHYVTAIANYIDSDQPVVALHQGDDYLSRYLTAGLGVHYVMRRNVRLMTEALWDKEREQARFVGGFTLAF